MSEQDETFDSADVFDDEALINQLAAGECLDEDAIGARLSAWREELELATPPILASAATVPEPARRRLPRSFVSTATALVVVAGGSVAAAAATGPGGPLGPLHRMLFGGSSADAPSVPDPTTGPVDSPTQSAIDVEPTAAPSVAISRIAAPTQRRTSTTGDGGDGSNGGSDGGSGDGSNDGSGGSDDHSSSTPTPSSTPNGDGGTDSSGEDGATATSGAVQTVPTETGGDDR